MTFHEMLFRQIRDTALLQQVFGDLEEATRKTNEAVSLVLGFDSQRGEALVRQREALVRLDEVVRRVALDTPAGLNEAMQAALQARLEVSVDAPKISALVAEAIQHIDHAKATMAAVEAGAERSPERPS